MMKFHAFLDGEATDDIEAESIIDALDIAEARAWDSCRDPLLRALAQRPEGVRVEYGVRNPTTDEESRDSILYREDEAQ